MNLSDMRLPRQIEADDAVGKIRLALASHPVKAWSGGTLEIARIAMSDPLKKALRRASLKGQLRFGFEAISETLEKEGKGIMNVRNREGALYGDRVSRMLLFSNDGAERLYRHIEHLLQMHAPRLIGCLLDIDSTVLSHSITGKDRGIKLVMTEHKEAVSEVLRAIAAGFDDGEPDFQGRCT